MLKRLLVFIFLFFVCADAFALDGVGVLTGYFDGSLKYKADYRGIPILVPFNFTLKDSDGVLKPKVEFIVEPFVNTIVSPDMNIEAGSNFLLNLVLPLNERFMPFLKGGVGALYMSQHTREQGSQWNFLPQAGMGFYWFFDETTAFTCEYRFRHLSNCGIVKPNGGINVRMILAGITYFFK
jgi:Lipid A 3-O-deacylase (PagL)